MKMRIAGTCRAFRGSLLVNGIAARLAPVR